MYKDYEIKKFLEALSSTESMPGGGVAALLVAANGISLALKVSNLSLGKEKYKEYERLIKEAIDKLYGLREEVYKLMDEDAANFKTMEDVYKMPKNTDDEKQKRKAALEDACKICCEVPHKTIVLIEKAIIIVKNLYGKTNVSAASDLKIGSLLLVTAAHSMWENIEINLKYISDKEFKISYDRISENLKTLNNV